jgi:hypothetical protein
MTRETIYVVQSFNAGKGRSLKADVPIPCRSAETARRTAERLAPAKAGVVAFSTAGDAELGELRRRAHHHLQGGTVAGAFQGDMSGRRLGRGESPLMIRPVRRRHRVPGRVVAHHRFFFFPKITFQLSLYAWDTGFWPSPR